MYLVINSAFIKIDVNISCDDTWDILGGYFSKNWINSISKFKDTSIRMPIYSSYNILSSTV